jgi:hypothetical protein
VGRKDFVFEYRPKRRQAEESGAFLKKSTKNLLTLGAGRPRPRRSQKRPKVFCLFFSKQQALLPLAFA